RDPAQEIAALIGDENLDQLPDEIFLRRSLQVIFWLEYTRRMQQSPEDIIFQALAIVQLDPTRVRLIREAFLRMHGRLLSSQALQVEENFARLYQGEPIPITEGLHAGEFLVPTWAISPTRAPLLAREWSNVELQPSGLAEQRLLTWDAGRAAQQSRMEEELGLVAPESPPEEAVVEETLAPEQEEEPLIIPDLTEMLTPDLE
ncbi:MAG: hypothetical protein ACFCU3_03425, partial [Verrucomicrobiales bacterium]